MLIQESDKKGNKIIGRYPNVVNSSINFIGKNNILFCEENVKLDGSKMTFNGNNSLIYLGGSANPYKINVQIYHDSVLHIGKITHLQEY